MCSKIADAIIEGKTGPAAAVAEIIEEPGSEGVDETEAGEPLIYTPDDE